MSTSRAILRHKDTTSTGALYMSFDLGEKQWQICVGDGRFARCKRPNALGAAKAEPDINAAELKPAGAHCGRRPDRRRSGFRLARSRAAAHDAQ